MRFGLQSGLRNAEEDGNRIGAYASSAGCSVLVCCLFWVESESSFSSNPGRRHLDATQNGVPTLSTSIDGDSASGGTTKIPIMTAYRQRALLCAALLAKGPSRPRDIKSTVPDAPKILLSNVYGWFARVQRGTYTLTDEGRAALVRWPQVLSNSSNSSASETGRLASS